MYIYILYVQSFSPTAWKRWKLQTLVSRTSKVHSNNQHLKNENEFRKKRV